MSTVAAQRGSRLHGSMVALPQEPSTAQAREPIVVMLGSSLEAPGGISSVLRSYRDEGLLDGDRVVLLPTWNRASRIDRVRSVLLAWWGLWRLLLQRRVSLVHAHAAAFGSFWVKSLLLMTAMQWRVPCVLHIHDGRWVDWYRNLQPWQQGLALRVLRGVDRVVVLSESWRQALLEVEPKARVLVLPNPVEVPVLEPGTSALIEPSAGRDAYIPQVLFLGRLWAEKGIYDLLRAVALVRERSPLLSAVQLICAGDGPSADVLERARQLGLGSSIHLPGWVEGQAKAKLLEQAQILVLPSHAEGMPVCVLEAMAAGVPVLASAVGAVPEMLSDGGGFCFKPGDVQRLADLIECLLLNPRQARLIGRRGRSVAAHRYARPLVVERLRTLYQELGANLVPKPPLASPLSSPLAFATVSREASRAAPSPSSRELP